MNGYTIPDSLEEILNSYNLERQFLDEDEQEHEESESDSEDIEEEIEHEEFIHPHSLLFSTYLFLF